MLLLGAESDWDDAVRQALRIGFESIVGYVHGGFAAWAEAGRPTRGRGRAGCRRARPAAGRGGPDAPLVIDVRQASEYEAGHVPGALLIGAGELPDRLDSLPRDRPIATICASGYRASVAASLLRAAGFARVVVGRRRRPDLAGGRHPVEYGAPEAGPWPGPAPVGRDVPRRGRMRTSAACRGRRIVVG